MTAQAGKWDVASIFESLAHAFPEVRRRSATIAASPGASSLDVPARLRQRCGPRVFVRQDKVAQYLYNGPEYLESVFASFRAGLVPVNTNYRYTEDELWYLWDNADVAAVVFHDEFAGRCGRLRQRLPGIRLWLHVGDPDRCPPWAAPYETAATSPPAPATAGVPGRATT